MLQALERIREFIKPMPHHINGPYLITMSDQLGQRYLDIWTRFCQERNSTLRISFEIEIPQLSIWVK